MMLRYILNLMLLIIKTKGRDNKKQSKSVSPRARHFQTEQLCKQFFSFRQINSNSHILLGQVDNYYDIQIHL